jgi:hypothetical protein
MAAFFLFIQAAKSWSHYRDKSVAFLFVGISGGVLGCWIHEGQGDGFLLCFLSVVLSTLISEGIRHELVHVARVAQSAV